MKSKKGLGMEFIITTSLLLISFFLIAGLLGKFAAKSTDLEAELLCHNSVALRVATAVNAGDSNVKLAPPICKTIDKKISGEREEIKKEFANLMARCWWMFNEGRQDELFEDSDLSRNAVGLTKTENDCFLCYSALVDENEIKGGMIQPAELDTYLIEKEYPKIQGTKYIDYIQGYGGPGRIVIFEPIEPRHGYGIVYLSKNKEGTGGVWSTGLVEGIAGVALAAGIVACIILEPCGATAGTSALVSTGIGAAAGITAGSIKAYAKVKADFFESSERVTSVIVVDDLQSVQKMGCGVDIAGQ